jgi:uncharacterized protein YbjT (DUF2867 family)
VQLLKTIFVTGATGNQGGGVTRDLLSNGLRVKALVRDPTRLNAHENLKIIKGDLNDPASYKDELNGVDGVFCNLHYNAGVAKEVKQGIDLINSAKTSHVKYFIYSSVIGCDLNTSIPHWESKFKIENHLSASGIDHAIIRPPSFYENLLFPQVKGRILKGKLVLPTPGNKVQQFMSAADVGKIATTIFSAPGNYHNTTINLAADQMDGEELASLLSEVMKRKVKHQQLPMFITRLVMGRDLAKMFHWVNHHDVLFVKDIDSFKKQFPPMISFRDWIKAHFEHTAGNK